MVCASSPVVIVVPAELEEDPPLILALLFRMVFKCKVSLHELCSWGTRSIFFLFASDENM